ncbi:Asparagine synthase (glutamine-hydrolyzing) (plasmid) [Tsukamurella tyrosinosolvens]|uniref:Asparagine synthase n=1 Tax=Tsukamurella tyrosinosolvens TaxID=57704 RepID=A0A1H4UER9_TSUTY|nr:asparagine synthase-related protein [Tsukamurella tyrosinosolvens]KXO92937.1 hypothetical protein AXK58_13790 [Tsukamurella tyrosinosolvens]SEC67352.1 Asparagine synthase [Tsukamurella tyrosinosolvens]VEH94181.1 Asparagine synthase (glutamine-hydrolyzing) [Tsukamurella tyrosinosolvens]
MTELRCGYPQAPTEFLTETVDFTVPTTCRRDITEPQAAAELLLTTLRERIGSVLAAAPDQARVVLMMGAGVDSGAVAGVLAELDRPFDAVTVATTAQPDEAVAASAISALDGATHHSLLLDTAEVTALSREALARLGLGELWAVAEAIPLLALRRFLDAQSGRNPTNTVLLTGKGADVLLLGGADAPGPLHETSTTEAVDAQVRGLAIRAYGRGLVDNFDGRLLGRWAPTLHRAYQSRTFWDAGTRLAPSAMFRTSDPVPAGGLPADKYSLRLACSTLPTSEFAWRPKDPLQRSSGLHAALHDAARVYAAELPAAGTFRDPYAESSADISARLFLELLLRG